MVLVVPLEEAFDPELAFGVEGKEPDANLYFTYPLLTVIVTVTLLFAVRVNGIAKQL